MCPSVFWYIFWYIVCLHSFTFFLEYNRQCTVINAEVDAIEELRRQQEVHDKERKWNEAKTRMISEAVNTSRRIANRKRYKEAEGVVQAMLTVEATNPSLVSPDSAVETRPNK